MDELLAYVGAELKKPQEEISDELVFLINSRIKPPKPVTKEDILIRTMFLVSDEVNSYGGRFPAEELDKLTELVVDSPVMVGHTKEKLPIARNFKAEVVPRDRHSWVKVWFYWLKSSRDALSLKENIDHGIYKECSLGFVFEFPECSICGQDMRKCPHIPFTSYQIGDGEKEAFFYYRNVVRVLETSLVYRGAVPNTSISDELRLQHKKEAESKLDLISPSDIKQKESIIRPFIFLYPPELNKSSSIANIFFHPEELSFLSGEFLIEPKYDGLGAQIHKQGDTVKIFSDEGEEIQQGFPHLKNEIMRNPHESFILDGELVKYKGNSRLSHADATSYVERILSSTAVEDQVPFDDSHFRFKTFDLLFLNGEDKTTLTLEQRKKLLEDSLEDTRFLQKVKYEKASADEAGTKARIVATSEGAVLKKSDAAYSGKDSWCEWRKYFDLDVLVTGSEKNKGGSRNFSCVIGTRDNPIPIGTTYSTFVEADPGEIIRVRVDSITEKDGRFVWHAPKVLGKKRDKKEPDSIEVLHRMVDRKTSTVHGQPSTGVHHAVYTTAQKELEATDGFILQSESNGDFQHFDLCFQGHDTAFGLTILELDLDALNRGRRFLCQWKEIKKNIPSKKEESEGKALRQQNAHLDVQDRGEFQVLDRQQDFVRLRIEGECLSGIHLARKIRLKSKERWLFWKQHED